MVDLGDWSIQFNYYEDLSNVDVVVVVEFVSELTALLVE